ncbi:MAG: hypothetical protein IPK35_07115 [Saprospiraceae bacterium]|nr:hypothetical protein [Saprospiraceae bacterium]
MLSIAALKLPSRFMSSPGNTVTNPANDGAGTLRSILACISDGGTIDFPQL